MPIGRFWIDEWRDQIRIVDIALVPEYRGAGIGSRLLHDVLDRGSGGGKPVTIHVEAFNPALRLYQRLGFEKVDTNGVYFLMRWTPPQVKTASTSETVSRLADRHQEDVQRLGKCRRASRR